MLRTITAVVLALLFVGANADAAGISPGLRLYTQHGMFRIGGPVVSSWTSTRGGGTSDGLMDPNAPPIGLRLGERVRFSLPAWPDHAPLLYTAAKLGYGNLSLDLDPSNPAWRPVKVGTFVVGLSLHATWNSPDDKGTSDSGYMFKVRIK